MPDVAISRRNGASGALLLAALMGTAASACHPAEPPLPHVVLIVIDTLRADRLGCYGAERDTSPAIDALAANAIRFDRAYSSAPWTSPAVASILTGLHPSEHGLVKVGNGLPSGAPRLPEILWGHGYATGAVVSHHLLSRQFGFAQGFELWDQSEALGHAHLSTPGVTRKALQILDEFAAGDRPFFLFVHYFDPHFNYLPHPEFGFSERGAGRLRGSESLQQLSSMTEDMTPEELAFLRNSYDEEIRFTDAGVGVLLDAMRELRLYDDSLIILVGDHGEEFLERTRIGHSATLYDELMRVPLIIRPARYGKAGAVVRQPVSVVSLTPTVLDLIGLGVTGGRMRSRPLTHLLEGRSAPPEPVFFEVDRKVTKTAVVAEPFKLIRDEETGELELYDFVRDAAERDNLVKIHPDTTRKLLTVLDEHLALARRDAFSPGAAEPSQDQVELLRELGYVVP